MRLKAWRTLKGLTQEQVADLMGISYVTVSRHESGVRSPRTPERLRYAQITEGAVTSADWDELWADAEAVAARAQEEASRGKRAALKAAPSGVAEKSEAAS